MHPERTTTIGTVARRAAAWGVLALVALVALKLVAGVVIGLVQFVFSAAILLALVVAVIWAIRRL
jgi:hypothetical protein